MPSTITAYNTFAPRTTIVSSEVNANFSNHRGTNIPISENTATALTDFSAALGTAEHRWGNSYIESIYMGRTTTSWQIKDATTTVGNLQFLLNGTSVAEINSDGFVIGIADVTPLTSKGDLMVNNGTISTRLPIGTDGYILTADSSATSGMAWKPAGGGATAETIYYDGYTSLSTGRVKFTTERQNTGGSLITVDNTTFTKITADADCYVVATASGSRSGGATNFAVQVLNSGGTLLVTHKVTPSASNNFGTASITFKLTAGDYVQVLADDALVNAQTTAFSVHAHNVGL